MLVESHLNLDTKFVFWYWIRFEEKREWLSLFWNYLIGRFPFDGRPELILTVNVRDQHQHQRIHTTIKYAFSYRKFIAYVYWMAVPSWHIFWQQCQRFCINNASEKKTAKKPWRNAISVRSPEIPLHEAERMLSVPFCRKTFTEKKKKLKFL